MKASRDITDPTIISILAIRSIAVLLYNNYPHASSIRQIIMMIGPAIPAIFMIRFQFIVIMRYVFKLQNTKKNKCQECYQQTKRCENFQKNIHNGCI